MEEDIIENSEINLPTEQQEHFKSLVDFLVGTYNALSQSVVDAVVVDENEEHVALVVDESVFTSVLDSLKDTANNFADVLGLDLEEIVEGEEDGNEE